MALGFQRRVVSWARHTFGGAISADRVERNHRFLEEALELAQACNCTKEEALKLVDYVFGRPKGATYQEVGGTVVTLALLCAAQGLDMERCGETELDRIWTKVEKIRAKNAAKPKFGPLPGADPAEHPAPAREAAVPSYRLANAIRHAFVTRYPKAFAPKGRDKFPLKVGIENDLTRAFDGVFKEWEIKLALRDYTRGRTYLRNVIEGASRFDLDGNPCGFVTAEQAGWAASTLAILEAEIAAFEASERAAA